MALGLDAGRQLPLPYLYLIDESWIDRGAAAVESSNEIADTRHRADEGCARRISQTQIVFGKITVT